MPTGAYTIDPNNASEPLDTRYVADMPAELRALKGKVNGLGVGGGGTEYYANIVDFGAVADFTPGPAGTGTVITDSASAVNAAIATGKPLYIPAGNFWIGDWATRLAYSRATVHSNSEGIVWGDTWSGKQQLGRTLFVGCASTHEISYAGGVVWAQNGSRNGTRQWLGFNNWMIMQPDTGPMQLQLYPGGKGQAITASCEAPNKLNAVYGTFDTALLRAGMHVGWNGVVYKIASVVSSAQITVTTFTGYSPAFVTSATQRPFYCYYEYSKFVGNVSGTAVTRASGDALPYGVSGDHMFCLINGTKYDVSHGPESTGSPHTLTLTSSAGTLTGASCEFFRTYGPWSYVSLFRLQGVSGGTETNGGMALNIKNELRIWNGGTHGELFGPIKLNAPKIALGEGNGSDTLGEQLETDSDGVWLGTSSSNAGLRNGLKAYGGPIGYLPVLAARGAESDKGLGFDIPGTGKFIFTSGTYGRINFEIYCPSGSNTWCTVTPGIAAATFSVNSSSLNADLVLAPKGSGIVKIASNPWLYFSFQNGWTDAAWGVPTGFRLDPGGRIVRLRGMINGGTNGTLIGYLPSGFRPPNTLFLASVGYNLTPAGIQIFSDGRVYGFGSGSPVAQICLDGITFHLD